MGLSLVVASSVDREEVFVEIEDESTRQTIVEVFGENGTAKMAILGTTDEEFSWQGDLSALEAALASARARLVEKGLVRAAGAKE